MQIVDGRAVINGATPTSQFNGNNVNNYAVRVARVEWISMKKIGFLSYTDEDGQQVEEQVDDTFATSSRVCLPHHGTVLFTHRQGLQEEVVERHLQSVDYRHG
jgi:peptide deformylase